MLVLLPVSKLLRNLLNSLGIKTDSLLVLLECYSQCTGLSALLIDDLMIFEALSVMLISPHDFAFSTSNSCFVAWNLLARS